MLIRGIKSKNIKNQYYIHNYSPINAKIKQSHLAYDFTYFFYVASILLHWYFTDHYQKLIFFTMEKHLITTHTCAAD